MTDVWGVDPSVSGEHPIVQQGVSADLLATLIGAGRADLDAYSLASQERAATAWDKGYFDGSVVPVRDVLGTPVLERDEHLRRGTTAEGLARAAPPSATGRAGPAVPSARPRREGRHG